MSSVPVIDFTAFGNGTKQERAELANRITQELTKYGAMRLINHGVTVESKSCSDRFVVLRACFRAHILLLSVPAVRALKRDLVILQHAETFSKG
jgi:hypothetical protein